MPVVYDNAHPNHAPVRSTCPRCRREFWADPDSLCRSDPVCPTCRRAAGARSMRPEPATPDERVRLEPRDRAIADMWFRGRDPEEIAAALHVSGVYVRDREQDMLIASSPTTRRWTARENFVVADMANGGRRNSEICAELGCTGNELRNQLRKMRAVGYVGGRSWAAVYEVHENGRVIATGTARELSRILGVESSNVYRWANRPGTASRYARRVE